MVVKFSILILSLILAINANAQDTTRVSIKVSDTTKLDESFGPVIEYPRPAIYDIWFKRIVICEGLFMPPQDEIDRIHFFKVNSESFQVDSSGQEYSAATYNYKHIMVLSLPNIRDYDVVAHEFLHFVLWYNFGSKYEGNDKHPQKYFGHCSIRNH